MAFLPKRLQSKFDSKLYDSKPQLNPTEALDAIEKALTDCKKLLVAIKNSNDLDGRIAFLPQKTEEAIQNAFESLSHLATIKQQVAELVAQNTTLIESLEEIVEPVAAMQRRCAALGDGRVIDGMMAIALANDPNNLKIIAKKALSNVTPPAAEGG